MSCPTEKPRTQKFGLGLGLGLGLVYDQRFEAEGEPDQALLIPSAIVARVRTYVQRILRVFALSLLAYFGSAWFSSRGHTQFGLWLGGSVVLLALGIGVVSAVRLVRGRREQSWELAIFKPALRPKAIAQLRRGVAKLTPVTHRTRSDHARLSVLLAELLDAQGDYEAAMAVIDAVVLTTLTPLESGLVRHTHAVVHLRAGDATGARRVLGLRQPTSDRELDQRLFLLELYARVEQGEAALAMQEAEKLALADDVHESVAAEARVVWAAALDAAGKREDALVVLMALGRDSLAPLAELGQPRARGLARAALEGSAA
jgi:hypothetical protein